MRARKPTYEIGLKAEQKSSAFLRRHGFEIVQHRFKVRQGEIDVIAADGSLLIFVEVKARETYEQAVEAITKRSRQRIVAAAEIWVQKNPAFLQHDQRFDMIIILPDGVLHHVPDAFRPGD